jgi:transposase
MSLADKSGVTEDTIMAKPLLSDKLWQRIEPLLPPRPPRPRGGRPPVAERAALTGILFVLRTGTPWELLPQEMGCGCGMTCWRRLRDWQIAGVWARIWQVLLDELGRADAIVWQRALVDSSSVRAVFGGAPPDPTPRTVRKTAANAMC